MDTKSRLGVRGFIDGGCRVGVGEVNLASAVQSARVAVKVGPAGATGAEGGEFKVRLVDACALEHRILGVFIQSGGVIPASRRCRSVSPPISRARIA